MKPYNPAQYINTPEQAAEYIQIMFDENGLEGFYAALGNVAKSNSMSDIAKKTGLGRASLYKSLTARGSPKFDTVAKVLDAIGVKITLKAA